MMNLIEVDTTPSTNSLLRTMDDAPHATVVSTRCQTAGRGQRGNTWEAEPGCNLTFSVLVRPKAIAASQQFAISRAVSLSIARVLRSYLPERLVAVKWPNDIYVDDLKICGILIENTLNGSAIERSIIGVGINVNQRQFRSDAPNPVSMAQLTGEQYDLDRLLREFAEAIVGAVEAEDASGAILTENEYLDNMWRREGFHPYVADGISFDAEIVGVDPTGILTLRQPDGTECRFAFKEVAAII